MDNDVLLFLQEFFSAIWSVFTNVTVPGTSISFATLWLGCMGSIALIGFLDKILNIKSDGAGGKKDYGRRKNA